MRNMTTTSNNNKNSNNIIDHLTRWKMQITSMEKRYRQQTSTQTASAAQHQKMISSS